MLKMKKSKILVVQRQKKELRTKIRQPQLVKMLPKTVIEYLMAQKIKTLLLNRMTLKILKKKSQT